jgi:hypothetical protein
MAHLKTLTVISLFSALMLSTPAHDDINPPRSPKRHSHLISSSPCPDPSSGKETSPHDLRQQSVRKSIFSCARLRYSGSFPSIQRSSFRWMLSSMWSRIASRSARACARLFAFPIEPAIVFGVPRLPGADGLLHATAPRQVQTFKAMVVVNPGRLVRFQPCRPAAACRCDCGSPILASRGSTKNQRRFRT